MASKKAPAPKKMTLKKAAVKRVPKVNPYMVRFGTRNELGPPRGFTTEVKARDAIIAELKSFEGWCNRHNKKGLDAIEAAKVKVGSITFHNKPSRIECCFDELYRMWICAEFWTTK